MASLQTEENYGYFPNSLSGDLDAYLECELTEDLVRTGL